MLGKLSKLIRGRHGKKKPSRPLTVRSRKPRRWAPRLETLDRRDLPSNVIATGSAYYIDDINNESIKIVAVAGVGFVPYHDNQPYYTNDTVQTQVEFTAGIPIYLAATGGVNTLTVDDRQGAAGNGYDVTSDQYGDQQLILGPTVPGANGVPSVSPVETITLETTITNRLLYVGEASTANNYVQITDNAGDGGTLGMLAECSGWDINGGGTTTLALDDHASTGAGTYKITNNQVYFQSSLFGGPQLVCTYGSISNMEISTSEPKNSFGVDTVGGDTVNVQSTSAGTTTTVIGNGEGTTYNIGTGTLDNLPGIVIVRSNIYGQVIMNDRGANSQPIYDIEGSSVTRPGFGGLSFNITSNTAVQNLTLNGPASATYDVPNDSAATTLNSGPGDNSFNIADGHLSTLLKKVTVNAANGGVNTLVVNDSTDPATGAFSIMPGSITRPGLAGVSYDSSLQNVTINSGFVGNQDFLVGNGDLGQTFGGAVFTINASGPNNSVILDDHLAGLFQGPYVITSNEVARAGAYFNYSGLQYLTLQGSNNDTDYLVASRSAFTTLSIGAGDLSALTGLTLNGQFDGLELDDHQSAFQGAYTITGTSVTRPGFVGVNYANHDLKQLTLDGANNGNTFLVDSTSLPTTINSGGDNSSFSISNDYTLDQFAGRVTINGKGVNNAVDLEDFDTSFHGTYTITSRSVDRPGFGGLTYSNVQVLGLTGSQGGNVYDVTGTSAKTFLYGLGGSNTIDLGGGSLNGLTGAVIAYGLGGSNSIVVDDHLASADENYTVTSTSVTRPGFGGLTYSGVQGLTLDCASSGNDTVTIGGGNLSAFGTVTVSNSGATAATSADTLAPVNVNINLGNGTNSLVLDDHLANIAGVYTITPGKVTRTGFGGLTYSNLQSLAVDDAGGSTIYVLGTSVPTTINVGGHDSIVVGAGELGDIQAPVTLAGTAGTDSVVVNDQNDYFAGAYTITSGSVTSSGFAGLNVTGEAIELIGSQNPDTYDITSTSATVLVQASGNGSTFNVGGGTLNNVQGAVTIDSTGDGDSVVVNDQNSYSNNNYTIAPNSVAKNGFTALMYQGVASLTVNGGSGGGAIYTVTGTSVPTTLNSGGGNNSTFNVGNGNLDGLAAPLSVTSGGSHGALDVDDTKSTAGQAYTITADQVSRPGAAAINSAGTFLRVELDAGNHCSTIDVQGTSAFYTLIQSGAAGDAIDVANASHSLDGIGGVLVQDVYGTSTVTADDSGHAVGDTYDVNNDSISIGRSSLFFLGYTGSQGGGGNGPSSIAALRLVTSPDTGNSVNIASTSVPTFISGAMGSSIQLGAGDLGPLMAPITISGGSASDSVLLDDQNATFQGAYTIMPNAVSRVGFGGLTYNGVNNLTVAGSNSNDLYNVQGAVANTHLHLGNGILTASINGTSSSAVSDGSLVATGSLTDSGGLSVGSGAKLAGAGSVIGPVSVAGVLSPGFGGSGQLSTGNLNLTAGSAYALGQSSGSNSQANVTGTVNLGGATLSLPSNLGANPGQQLVLVSNDGSDPVVGTFGGLPEGSTITAGGHTFTISYKGGDGNDVVLTQVGQPTVTSVQVNDGSAQRSEVRSITVTFSGSVTFAGGNANAATAFQLTNLTDFTNVNLIAAVSTNLQGQTVVTLTFAGSETDAVSARNGGVASLADGRYQLTILSANVTGTGGAALAGGGQNGNYVSPSDSFGGTGLHLYRLFGDVNGDGVVDSTDLGLFRSSFNSNASLANYISYLDSDNSGAIDSTDLGQFRVRFNQNVF
jgi:hypothetical protein